MSHFTQEKLSSATKMFGPQPQSDRRGLCRVFLMLIIILPTRGILEMKLQNIMCDRKHLYESQSVQLKEKNRYGLMWKNELHWAAGQLGG